MGAKLSPAQLKRLARDGYIVVPGVVPAALTAPALREINHRLGTGEHPGLDEYSRSMSDYLSEHGTAPALMNLGRGPVRELVESLLGAGRVEPSSDAQTALRFPAKSADAAGSAGIHIDLPGGGLNAKSSRFRYTVCAGILLSDLPRAEMGNLVIYPGSYRLISDKIKARGLAAFEGRITDGLPMPAPVPVLGKVGDVVLFHFLTAHGVAPNLSPDIRYMAYFRFWHIDAWLDQSSDYLLKALVDPLLEWPAARGVR